MKKGLLLLIPIIIIGILLAVNTSCENPLEECSSDEVCDGKDPVSTCCTEGQACVYKYNGKEYPVTEAGKAALAADMNCTSIKSGEIACNEEAIMQRLEEILEKTKALSMR